MLMHFKDNQACIYALTNTVWLLMFLLETDKHVVLQTLFLSFYLLNILFVNNNPKTSTKSLCRNPVHLLSGLPIIPVPHLRDTSSAPTFLHRSQVHASIHLCGQDSECLIRKAVVPSHVKGLRATPVSRIRCKHQRGTSEGHSECPLTIRKAPSTTRLHHCP